MEVLAQSSPTIISSLAGEEIVQLTASGDVSAALTAKGQVYTWGRTKGGVLLKQEADKDSGSFS